MDRRVLYIVLGVIVVALGIFSYKFFFAETKLDKPTYIVGPDNLSIKVGEEITFEDKTRNATSWIWEFGDGQGSKDRKGNHIYYAAGEYRIRLTVTGSFGTLVDSTYIVTVSSTTTTSYKDEEKPTAKVLGPATAKVGQKITLTYTIPGATKWTWDFGEDGRIIESTTGTQSYVYALPGTYKVIVKNDKSGFYQGEHTIVVTKVEAPAAAPAGGGGGGATAPASSVKASPYSDNTIKGIFQEAASSGSIPSAYYTMKDHDITFCEGEQTKVQGKNGTKSLKAYMNDLKFSSNRKIVAVKSNRTPEGCITLITVTEQ